MGDKPLINLVREETWRATSELRWQVSRDHENTALQQKWFNVTSGEVEWKDVPVVMD